MSLAILLGVVACHVDETQSRCETDADCVSAQECYLGYCVRAERSDASASDERERNNAVSEGDASLRRRGMPTFTGTWQSSLTDDDAGIVRRALPDECISPSGGADEDGGTQGQANDGDDLCCDADLECYAGPADTRGIGRCKAGVRRCRDGVLGMCEGAVLPREEACDNAGVDDDCDGKVDNIPGLGAECRLPGGGMCGDGERACVEGEATPQCQPLVTSLEESCNEQDDDCDGKVDEGFDLMGDELHCGACGVACELDLVCCAGACVAATAGAPDGCPSCDGDAQCDGKDRCCGGSCADTMTDHDNCGVCGNVCGDREECCGGVCVDPRRDVDNCGACGTVCSEGAQPGCCGGACVDLTRSDSHCGRCGNNCGVLCGCVTEGGETQCQGPLGVCFF